MADDSDITGEQTPDLNALATQIADAVFDVKKLARLERAIRNAHAEGETVAHAAQYAATQDYLTKTQSATSEAYTFARRGLAWALAHVVSHLLGVEVPESALDSTPRDGGDSIVGRALGETFLGALTPPSGTIEPGREGADRLIGMLTIFALNTWFESTVIEQMVSIIPTVGHAEEIGKLGQQLISATGLDELGRLAFRPLANITVSTPLTWHANKTYRPALLPDAEVVKAFQRGDYTADEVREELARGGYSDRRQDILLKSAFRNVGADDALTLERAGVIDRGLAIEKLKAQGYAESEATLLITAAEIRRHNGIEDNGLSALTRAYVNRDIDESGLRTLFPPNLYTDLERDTFETQARLQRDLNVRHLSEAQVVDAVKFRIVPMAYYRAWMAREGFPDEEQLIKELLLRAELDKEAAIEELREQALTERAREKADREAAQQKRQAELEQERALARRGPVSELIRGVVRGLIPPARLEEVLAAQYDPDTVRLFVDDAAQQRAEYLEQQQRAEALRNRAKIRHVDVADLEQAVLNDILTLDQYRTALLDRDFAAADANLLTANLRIRKIEYDAAVRKRRDAEERAKRKAIDLGRFEQLVRRGVRTLPQYAALLRSLDFDDVAIADMTELLRLQIADDTKAREERARAAALRDGQGVSLEQARRAVILELRDLNWFQRWLIDNHFTTDAQALLVAEVRVDLDEARAARAKRHAADAVTGAAAIPLSTVARAARLGLITPALYQQRLTDAGYADDDIAIELALLTHEIADVQAARAKQAAADQPAAPGLLTLTQMAAAVRAGLRALSDYRALALADGLDDDAVTTLTRVLGDELAATDAARIRREQLGSTLQAKDISLADLTTQVKTGGASLAEFHATLVQAGLDPVDAALLTALLGDELAGGGPRG